ncbi:Putative Myb family transcription factor [Zea mays]|uniref:Putative Myb family transcription factor n=1 Tax=Zea mays TaxID=4577 RepID=A0A1D6JMJ2_MAIZE|nr:Putative Myb family transcription factor [Zea mays]
MHACMLLCLPCSVFAMEEPNNSGAGRRREREEMDGSASPKRVLLRGGPGPGTCEGDGSPSPPSASGGLCWALATAAAGGYNSYMRMMQAAMGMAAGARAPPPRTLRHPPRHAETTVEPSRGPGIKRQAQMQSASARPGAQGGEHAAPALRPRSTSSSEQLITFSGFVVAQKQPPPPPPPCCSRDHPFEMVGTALIAHGASAEARCGLETPPRLPAVAEQAGGDPCWTSSAGSEDDHDEEEDGCSLSLSLATRSSRSSGDEGGRLSPTAATSWGSQISLDLSLSTL